MINTQKIKAYSQASEHELEESTEEWKEEWQCNNKRSIEVPASSGSHTKNYNQGVGLQTHSARGEACLPTKEYQP